MAALEAEIKAFESSKAELEKHHMGKWALFHEKEFVGAYDTFDSAASEAVRQFGRGPYLIRQVGAPPVTLPASVLYHPLRSGADY